MQRRPFIPQRTDEDRNLEPHAVVPEMPPRPSRTDIGPKLADYVQKHTVNAPYMTPNRILTDLDELKKHPLEGVHAGPVNDNLHEWLCVLDGPTGTVYEGGVFFVELNVPQDYPFKAPSVRFKTRIYHPNIDSQGRVCVDLIASNWTATMTLYKVIEGIVSLLYFCHPEDALVPAIGQMYVNDYEEFVRMAKLWTQRYSIVSPSTTPAMAAECEDYSMG